MYLGNGPRAEGRLATRAEDKARPFPLAILFLSFQKPLCPPRARRRGTVYHHPSFTRKGDEDGAAGGQFCVVAGPAR